MAPSDAPSVMYHLAEFNIGTLMYDWDDPRVADFANNLDLVNGIAARAPGFVWRLTDNDMDAAQNDPLGPMGGNPRTASTLSVWEDLASLEAFVWNTIHKRFYDRRGEWYGEGQSGPRLVMWWVPAGHRPTIGEAMERYNHMADHGPSPYAFGWDGARAGPPVTQG